MSENKRAKHCCLLSKITIQSKRKTNKQKTQIGLFITAESIISVLLLGRGTHTVCVSVCVCVGGGGLQGTLRMCVSVYVGGGGGGLQGTLTVCVNVCVCVESSRGRTQCV